MKVSVKYNDAVGSAAADFEDGVSLASFLKSNSINTEELRENPIGLQVDLASLSCFAVRVICKKQDNSLVAYSFNLEFDKFFAIFKRFQMIISDRAYSSDLANVDHSDIETVHVN